jgi:hypothetical protein
VTRRRTSPLVGEATKQLFWGRVDRMIADLEQQTTQIYPVYVPSKARSHYRLVTDLFDEHTVAYRVVVEPQDAEDYEARFGDRLLVMPENNRGIAYVRNFMKDHARSEGHLFHWQVDDNVVAFRVRRGGQGVAVSPRNVMSVVEQSTDLLLNVGGAGIANSAWVFTYDEREPVEFNHQVYCAMLLNTAVQSRFRPDVHDDTDYSLQMLADGWVTLVFKRLSMDKTTTGVMTGGNTEIEYANGKRLTRFQNTARLWPANFKVGFHDDGRPRLIKTGGYRMFKQLPDGTPALYKEMTWADY